MHRLFVVTCAVMLAIPGTATAHDFWLYPSTHQLAEPGEVSLRIRYGQPGEIDELERRRSHLKRFEAHGPSGPVTITGMDGNTPAGHVTLPVDGIFAIIYQSTHNLVQLEPRKFDGYLAEEGLLEIIADREQRGESERPGLDSFARYAKALVRVGDSSDGYDRRLGMPTELVALADPFVGGRDGELEFQLWNFGKTHEGALVELFEVKDDEIIPVAVAKTDRDGRAAFATPGIGRWMVTATTMRRAAFPLEGDWDSSWASLSFEVASTAGMPTRSRWPAFATALGVCGLLAGGLWSMRRK